MNFNEWVENNYFKGHEPSEDRLKDIKYGWDACKQEALKILKQDLNNLDLSIDSCDKRYIEKIEKL